MSSVTLGKFCVPKVRSSQKGNWKQWKWKPQMEMVKSWMQVYTRVEPLIYDYLPLYNGHLSTKIT